MFRQLKSLFSSEDLPQSLDDPAIAAAALLFEAAAADGEIGTGERDILVSRITAFFDLSPEQSAELIAKAEAQAISATHLLRFTRTVKDAMDADARFELMVMLWEVVLADNQIDPFEDQLLRRIGGLIYVSDKDRGAARRQAEANLGATQ